MPHFGRSQLTKIAVLGVVAAIAAGALVWYNGRSDYADHPETILSGKQMFHFDSLADMTATSTVVVKARVEDVKVGRVVGAGSGDPMTLRAVSLAVLDVLAQQSPVGRPSTITLEEVGWDSSGKGLVQEGLTWSTVGDVGFFFLRRNESGAFDLVSTQGRILIYGDKLTPSEIDAPLGQQIASRAPNEVAAAIHQAARDVKAGRISSQQPRG